MNCLWKNNSLRKSVEMACRKMPSPVSHNQNKQSEDVSQALPANKKRKRYRSAFTTSQVAVLEQEFKKAPYVNNLRREQLATSLSLPERAIKIWFQNRRMKEKRESTAATDTDVKTTPIMTGNTTRANKQFVKSTVRIPVVSGGKTKSPMSASTPKSCLKYSKKTNAIGSSSIPKTISLDDDKRLTDSQKQPVGHVQPFSQVAVIQSQKTQQKKPVTKETTKSQEPLAYNHFIRAFGTDPQPTAQFPQPLPFSGLIPVLPPDASSLLYAGPQPQPYQMDLGLGRKCCCDCHRPDILAATSTPSLQVPPFFYTHYFPQFLTPSLSTGPFSH